MTSTMNQSPRIVTVSSSSLKPGARVSLALLILAVHLSTASFAQQPNSNSGRRQHVATLRSSDSQEGSRVAISSDQSLNNYEAYRRGDRFYVKIPASDVSRPDAVRGRGFADVKAQSSGDSTVLSFRLQPGATAHVEQRANKLDVVVTVPGGSPGLATARPGQTDRLNPADEDRANTNKRGATLKNSNSNDAGRIYSSNQSSLNSNRKTSVASNATSVPPAATASPEAAPSLTPAATLKSSPAPKPAASAALPTSGSAQTSPANSSANTEAQQREDFWNGMKERGHYWLLLAQLNPIPVAVGAALLILIIGLLLVQRRRAKTTRRLKPLSETARRTNSEPLRPQPANVASKRQDNIAVPVAASIPVASAASELAAASSAASVVPPASAAVEDARHERVNRVAGEATRLFDGKPYDEAIIGSEDRDTRRLVGAELLSALVGRNVQRRERAREAFMKHGYFDDATRDLRVSESDTERAAAARRLSFVHDRDATPHLIGALNDQSPDVRRASVEALMDLRDPAAIGPLNSLLQTESDRKVPRTLIKHAIEACATSVPQAIPAARSISETFPASAPQSFETDREVIEL